MAVYFAVSRPRVYENRRLKTKALGFPRLVSRNHHETKCLCFEPLRFRFDQTWIVKNVNEKQAHHKIQGFGFGHRNLAQCRNPVAVQEFWARRRNPGGKLTIRPDFYKSYS